MTTSTPDVSFIIVNYFSQDMTLACVASILEKTRTVSFEIVVVDNQSGFEASALHAMVPEARVVMNDHNEGYGRACHRGAQVSRGRYLYFLNSDIALLNDAAGLLTSFCDAHPEAGLVGAYLVQSDGRHTAAFDYFPTLGTKLLGIGFWRWLHPERFPKRDGSLTRPTPVDLVSGSNLLMPAAFYRSLGGFDPQFFLYCEEEDLGLRVWQAGKKVFHFPDARLKHIGGGSSQGQSEKLKKEFYISYFKFYRKHYGLFRTFLLQGFVLFQLLIRGITGKERVGRLLGWYRRGCPSSETLYRS